jgi:hypothetical protein
MAESRRTGFRSERSAIPAKEDRGPSEAVIERSYCRMHQMRDIASVVSGPRGLGRPTISGVGRSPVGGGNAGHMEMAACLIYTRPLKIISNAPTENARSPGKWPFPDFHGYFHGNPAGPTGGHH